MTKLNWWKENGNVKLPELKKENWKNENIKILSKNEIENIINDKSIDDFQKILILYWSYLSGEQFDVLKQFLDKAKNIEYTYQNISFFIWMNALLWRNFLYNIDNKFFQKLRDWCVIYFKDMWYKEENYDEYTLLNHQIYKYYISTWKNRKLSKFYFIKNDDQKTYKIKNYDDNDKNNYNNYCSLYCYLIDWSILKLDKELILEEVLKILFLSLFDWYWWDSLYKDIQDGIIIKYNWLWLNVDNFDELWEEILNCWDDWERTIWSYLFDEDFDDEDDEDYEFKLKFWFRDSLIPELDNTLWEKFLW